MVVGWNCLAVGNVIYHCVSGISDWNVDDNRFFGNGFCSGTYSSTCNGRCFGGIIKKNTENIWLKI